VSEPTFPEASVHERIRNNLEELGMDRMAANAAECLSLAASGALTMPEALLRLTEGQVETNRERDLWRRVEKSNFPFLKTLADFDFSFQPSIERSVVEDLASLAFLERGDNVVMIGTPGVGKTHIAVAIGIEAVRARKLTYFIDCQSLLEDLARADERGSLERRLRYYAHSSLLIVDEIGYLAIDPKRASLFYQLVNRRYEKHSTIVTTNAPIRTWGDVFGDLTTANAIADKLLHHCTLMKISGRSWRTKDLYDEDDRVPSAKEVAR
jgi:DNA replication protein DnaC